MATKAPMRTMVEVDESLISGIEESLRLLHGVDTDLLHLTDFGKVSTFNERQVDTVMRLLNDMAHGNTRTCEEALEGLAVLRSSRRAMAGIERTNRRLHSMLLLFMWIALVETVLIGYYELRPFLPNRNILVKVQDCRGDGCVGLRVSPLPPQQASQPVKTDQ